jgi:cell division protein FtsL
MPSHAAARRRAPAHGRTRTSTPRFDRRVSGPTHAVALPAAPRRGTTGLFERIRALPDTRVVDRVLRGRACIWIIGILLGGIVAMQVSLLKLNSSISTSIEQASALERVNGDLENEVSQLSSGDRIEQAAVKEGMVSPSAGDVGFLRSRPSDVGLALKRMTAPSEQAREVMANGGHATGVVAGTTAPVVAAAAPTATVAPAVATPAPTAAAAPTATPAPVVTQAPPAATAAPAATTAPVVTAGPTG